jgi:hypothetical protein
MKTSIANGKSFLHKVRISNKKNGLWILIFTSCFSFNELKSQNCDLCKIQSFPSLTVYQAFQTGHGMGFGVEAGTWNKDAGKFSYFIGTSLVWADNTNIKIKTGTASPSQTLLSFYLKGQYQLMNHFYVVAAPGIVNLTYFEFQSGLRYVVPISRIVGVGIEPAYAFGQKQFVVNANLHFALR